MIGKEESMKTINFFEKSFNGLTIDCMYLAHHGEANGKFSNVPRHKENYATLEITLNDNYDGGHEVEFARLKLTWAPLLVSD